MEGTYSTSDYMNNIMLKKILGKTGDVQKNQRKLFRHEKIFCL